MVNKYSSVHCACISSYKTKSIEVQRNCTSNLHSLVYSEPNNYNKVCWEIIVSNSTSILRNLIQIAWCSLCISPEPIKPGENMSIHNYKGREVVNQLLVNDLTLSLSGLIQQTIIWGYFSQCHRKQDLTVHANYLHWRQYAWNVKFCFLEKIREVFQNWVCWKFYLEC